LWSPAAGAILAAEVHPMTMGRTLSAGILVALATTGLGCAEHRAAPGKDTSTAEADKEAFGRMTIDELEAKMAAAKAGQAKLAIFDNNQHDRFDKGHIPGAKWVKFSEYTASEMPADKDTTLVFYCSNEH
jgi:Rhodanese-like domain